jgi:hypothetical protein
LGAAIADFSIKPSRLAIRSTMAGSDPDQSALS